MSSTTGSQVRGVVVTGAGSGIGRATALRFAQLGDKVLVAELNADGAEAVVKEIEAGGGTARAVVGDLSDQHTADEVISAAVEAFGGLDVLVNNAGIMDTMTATADVSDAEWERVIRINLTAPFLLTRAALPHLLARGNGAIVNTASEAALRGSAAGTAYTVSKHGIIGLTKSTAVMYRDRGVRVNAVAPGGTLTHITDTVTFDGDGASIVGRYQENVGRVAAAEEVAAAIVFLASDAASNISGAVLPVDNGWSAV
ncbi:SDR family NAD(P)-dependent oxidoreductase [Streptomyces soliscabiei]|uniref:SDR family NAD(P)-dependent oxidoreductase n=1 Tax=Streptomyces soliscabiei TaxID=588897 RepID=UPI0029A81244|nr:SDR family NAD(P)-dependent oxidoreductase [Streptomyces sp. NY05-11A]MDX2683752.1 SDR family oxidoreductase [Streptomyces sp. NY05-11A]